MDRAACFNVPKHHRNLWREYAEETPHAERVHQAGDERAAGFSDGFVPELYHRLYAELPREVATDERAPAAAVRAKLHDLAGELPEFETLRKQTVRDPLWAGMAAYAMAESLVGTIPEKKPTPDADRALSMLKGLEALEAELPEESSFSDVERAIEQATKTLDAANDGVADQASCIDESAVRNAMRAGIEAAGKAIDEAKSALVALGWGDAMGSGSGKDPGVAVELARRVRSSASLKRIVELAGRLTLTARAKRASRTEYARSELVGVEQTGDVSRLLPCELVSLSTPTQTAALYRRLLERSALGYKMSGKERSAKGPIVIVLDQSSSMSEGGKDEWAKAVALALLDAARAERRAFGIVLYNGDVVDARLFPSADDADPRVILDLLSRSPYGGTCYAPAIRQALRWIAGAGTFKRADIVHVTDGEASLDGYQAARLMAKDLGAHIFGIGIGFAGPALEAWSDDVSAIRDVGSDSPAIDLIFDHI